MNESDLKNIGQEVCRLLVKEEYDYLANKYGYALAFDMNPADALKADFRDAIGSDCRKLDDFHFQIDVKGFHENTVGILFLVACIVSIKENTNQALVELILNKNEKIYIEQISSLA